MKTDGMSSPEEWRDWTLPAETWIALVRTGQLLWEPLRKVYPDHLVLFGIGQK